MLDPFLPFYLFVELNPHFSHIYINPSSKTQLTADVIAAAKKLMCIGAFCIGTNQIDLVAAQKRGVLLTPFYS